MAEIDLSVQAKTAEDVRDDIITALVAETSINDQETGSVLHTLAHAMAEEVDGAYYENWKTRRAFFLDTATGQALDEHALASGLQREQGNVASVLLRFSGTVGASIPAGTLVAVPTTASEDRIVFETSSSGSYSITVSGTVDVPATALLPGSQANVGAGQIVFPLAQIPGVTDVTNPAAALSGRDEENDAELRGRVKRHLAALSRGTVPSLRQAAMDFRLLRLTLAQDLPAGQGYLEVSEDLTQLPLPTEGSVRIGPYSENIDYTGIDTSVTPHRLLGLSRGQHGSTDTDHLQGLELRQYVPETQAERVTSVFLVEAAGRVTIYIDDGTASGPSTELTTLVQKRLSGDGTDRNPGYRGAGIMLYVQPRKANAIDVLTEVVVDTRHGSPSETQTRVAALIRDWLNRFDIGEHVEAYDLVGFIKSDPGVNNIVSLSIESKTFVGTRSADVAIPNDTVARAGVITVQV